MPDTQSKKILTHYLYSGLGGHGSVFFSLVEADKEHEFDYRAVFCGIEELREEYKNSCERLALPYEYVKKKRGRGAYFKVFRIFSRIRPSVLFLHGVSFSIVSATWYKITRPGTRILVRDTQAHHLKSKSEWFWMFFCLLFSNRMIFLTPESAAGVRKRFGWFARKKKLVVIPNGLKIENYKPVAIKPAAATDFVIGMQSRLQPIKDHPVLIKAFKQLKEMNPGKKLSLHIAGDGETMPQLKKMVAELGLEDSVKLFGMLNGNELISFMGSLDIYVHATFGETLSNSIMQSLACGLPTIASNVWGVNNMIWPDQNGLLYESGNAEQLASEINELVGNEEKRRRLGAAARQFALDHYDNAVMFRSYRELF